eukprot:CAMPEP_0194218532 /NCGR_PEP_ID=MMETSP0156-20130528/23986_1 /TAXON_ID=33649 /ORGANISM="Thalassionema nitzschioides, Strain L26-B" /LENGTH=38 /DNA_ID= /DNA_START= /DNA_END= /DNA_ORIENTATION=
MANRLERIPTPKPISSTNPRERTNSPSPSDRIVTVAAF